MEKRPTPHGMKNIGFLRHGYHGTSTDSLHIDELSLKESSQHAPRSSKLKYLLFPSTITIT